MDIWTQEKRSQVMSLIKAKDTKPERLVQKIIRGLGYRYKLNVKGLPGSPDIVLVKYKSAIFVHGCFWHFHGKCRDGKIPASNKSYWRPKLHANRGRDIRNKRALLKKGWKVLTLWECQVKRKSPYIVKKIKDFLSSNINNKMKLE